MEVRFKGTTEEFRDALVVHFCERAKQSRGWAKAQRTLKETRYHEGQAAAYDEVSNFLAAIKIEGKES